MNVLQLMGQVQGNMTAFDQGATDERLRKQDAALRQEAMRTADAMAGVAGGQELNPKAGLRPMGQLPVAQPAQTMEPPKPQATTQPTGVATVPTEAEVRTSLAKENLERSGVPVSKGNIDLELARMRRVDATKAAFARPLQAAANVVPAVWGSLNTLGNIMVEPAARYLGVSSPKFDMNRAVEQVEPMGYTLPKTDAQKRELAKAQYAELGVTPTENDIAEAVANMTTREEQDRVMRQPVQQAAGVRADATQGTLVDQVAYTPVTQTTTPNAVPYMQNPALVTADMQRAKIMRDSLANVARIKAQYGTAQEVDQAIAALAKADSTLDYLQGMQAINAFDTNPGLLAQVWSRATGITTEFQPLPNGNFNLFQQGRPVGMNVPRASVINSARSAFDNAFLAQQVEMQKLAAENAQEIRLEQVKGAYDIAAKRLEMQGFKVTVAGDNLVVSNAAGQTYIYDLMNKTIKGPGGEKMPMTDAMQINLGIK